MFNYIKWELKDFFKNKRKILIFIAVIMVLFLLVPKETNALTGIIVVFYSFIMVASLILTYYSGTIRIVKTYEKKTFLLESMIPLSTKKILASKYILGMIINFVYFLLGFFMIILIALKYGSLDKYMEVLNYLFVNVDYSLVFKSFISFFLGSLSFMSMMVLCYVISKVLFPNKKGSLFLGVVIFIIFLYLIGQIFSSITGSELLENYPLLVFNTYNIIAIVTCFFATDYLVNNKLEIYN